MDSAGSSSSAELRGAEYGREEVVEVVGDAAGELTHRFHALGFAELLLQPHAVREIEHRTHHADGVAMIVANHGGPIEDGRVGAVASQKAVLGRPRWLCPVSMTSRSPFSTLSRSLACMRVMRQRERSVTCSGEYRNVRRTDSLQVMRSVVRSQSQITSLVARPTARKRASLSWRAACARRRSLTSVMTSVRPFSSGNARYRCQPPV